ncbi:MAG: ATP-binding protein, partial [Myxococcota bacterium]
AVDGPPCRVEVVPERIETAVRNLLANACHHATGRVWVATEVRPGEAALVVRDDGPGLDEAELRGLFLRYHTTRVGGTGLGLPMTRAIVEAHGGTVAAEAAPGGGATFRIALPTEA